MLLCSALPLCYCCEPVDTEVKGYYCEEPEEEDGLRDSGSSSADDLSKVARLLSTLDIGVPQMAEVHDAVSNSISNGYDEEYLMKNLFSSPGSGVGDDLTKASGDAYPVPLRDLIRDALDGTKASSEDGESDEDSGLAGITEKLMTDGGMQIFWPYSSLWDGETLPVITYNPGSGAVESDGYMLTRRPDGSLGAINVKVDERMAMQYPVWVVNVNDDSEFMTVERLRKFSGTKALVQDTKAPTSGTKSLVMKDFTMLRQFDSWLAGASEFWIKIAGIEDFNARTEAELRQYDPMVTDFVIVVRRDEVGKKRDINTILMSNWTPALSSCAFMIIEDDGGTVTSWTAQAVVKINSKSYGVELTIPFRKYDDVVWRGNLTYGYITSSSNMTGHFGDVELTFEVIDSAARD